MKAAKKVILAMVASMAIGSSVFGLDLCQLAGCPGFHMYKTVLDNQTPHTLSLSTTNWYSVQSMHPQLSPSSVVEVDHDASMISQMASEMDPSGNVCGPTSANVLYETVQWGCPVADAPFVIDYDMNLEDATNPGMLHLCHVHAEVCLDYCDIAGTSHAASGWPGYVHVTLTEVTP